MMNTKNSAQPMIITIAGRMIDTRLAMIVLLACGVGLYVIGLHWPLLLLVTIFCTLLLPMPRIFSSWLGRFVLSTIFVYALLLVASLVQFALDPNSLFTGLTVILSLVASVLIFPFGDFTELPRLPLVNKKDAFILIPCFILFVALSPVLLGSDNIEKITVMAGTQIPDAIAHYSWINGFIVTQHLNFSVGDYYPLGFHDVTAYIENTLFGNVNNNGWTGHVVIYIVQYLLFALQMLYILVYLGYSLLRAFIADRDNDNVGLLIVATTIGIGTIMLHSLLFINQGFLNFYYVCSTLLVSMMYLLDNKIAFTPGASLARNLSDYAWPITAFLLLGFGASFSWTLFAPVVLLSAALVIMPDHLQDIRKVISVLPQYLVANISVACAVLLNLVAIYMQYHFSTSNTHMLIAAGAIRSFNIPLLLIGLTTTAFVASVGAPMLGKRLVALVLPYLILLGFLMLGQMFVLGEMRYYVLKTAIVVEMFSLAIIAASVARWLHTGGMGVVNRFLWSCTVVVFLIVATIGLEPQPLLEVRSLLRTQSHLSKPPFLDSDSAAIASLGVANKIRNFNVTILHYEASDNKLYAHIEPALWANAMTKAYVDPDPVTKGSKIAEAGCFLKQFSILAYGTGSPAEQQTLRQDVADCISTATMQGQSYYIVTDPGSVAVLRQLFGPAPALVTK